MAVKRLHYKSLKYVRLFAESVLIMSHALKYQFLFRTQGSLLQNTYLAHTYFKTHNLALFFRLQTIPKTFYLYIIY